MTKLDKKAVEQQKAELKVKYQGLGLKGDKLKQAIITELKENYNAVNNIKANQAIPAKDAVTHAFNVALIQGRATYSNVLEDIIEVVDNSTMSKNNIGVIVETLQSGNFSSNGNDLEAFNKTFEIKCIGRNAFKKVSKAQANNDYMIITHLQTNQTIIVKPNQAMINYKFSTSFKKLMVELQTLEVEIVSILDFILLEKQETLETLKEELGL